MRRINPAALRQKFRRAWKGDNVQVSCRLFHVNSRQRRTLSSTLTVFVLMVLSAYGYESVYVREDVETVLLSVRASCAQCAPEMPAEPAELVLRTGSAARRRPRGVGSMFRLVMSESVKSRGDGEEVFDTEPRVRRRLLFHKIQPQIPHKMKFRFAQTQIPHETKSRNKPNPNGNPDYSLLLMIFPLVVFGSSSRNSTMRGYL